MQEKNDRINRLKALKKSYEEIISEYLKDEGLDAESQDALFHFLGELYVINERLQCLEVA